MYYVDLTSLALGFIGGISATITLGGFTVLVMTELQRHAFRRKLAERHKKHDLLVSELSQGHHATLPVVAPQKDSTPATTAAGTRRSQSTARSNASQTSGQRSSRAGRVPNGSARTKS